MAKGGGGEGEGKNEGKFMKLERIWKEHNNETHDQWQMKLSHRESEMIWSKHS